MAYSFDIEYVKTDAFGQADGLSRLPAGDDVDFKESATIDAELHQVFTERLNEAPLQSKEIAEETEKDKLLQKVPLLHKNGWPNHLSSGFDKEHLPFFKICHELESSNHCLLWGLRTIIPSSLRQKMLDQLHKTHPGQSTMKRMARKYFWWPRLDKDIEEMVSACHACNKVLPNPPKVLLRPWPIAERPWQRIHIDFAGPFLGSMWFVAIDAHSKWPEVFEMKQQKTHTAEVVVALSEMFCRWGICEEIVSDNGPQFTSEEFKRFCFDNGIKHTLTAPYHPQSNGQVKRFIQTFKNALLKAQTEEGKEERKLQVLHFLQRYRLTPHPTTEEAPAELFLKQTPRSHWDLIYPSAMATMEKNRLKMKEQFDQHKKDRALFPGAQVLVRNFNSKRNHWVKGTIVEQLGSVKWRVQVAGQKTCSRHSNQLRLLNGPKYPASLIDHDPPSLNAFVLPQDDVVIVSEATSEDEHWDSPEADFRSLETSIPDSAPADDAIPVVDVAPPVTTAPTVATRHRVAENCRCSAEGRCYTM
uniref:RNA-directed DNA polymerase n=1 Tax=Plectus sambesii TaxID=2011161 RepID=A0A914XQD5_9BILA